MGLFHGTVTQKAQARTSQQMALGINSRNFNVGILNTSSFCSNLQSFLLFVSTYTYIKRWNVSLAVRLFSESDQKERVVIVA